MIWLTVVVLEAKLSGMRSSIVWYEYIAYVRKTTQLTIIYALEKWDIASPGVDFFGAMSQTGPPSFVPIGLR